MLEFRDLRRSDLVMSGKVFFLAGKRQRTYLKGAMVNLDLIDQDRLWFPGVLYFDIPKHAQSIYLGTLRYTRNDFNEIEKCRAH